MWGSRQTHTANVLRETCSAAVIQADPQIAKKTSYLPGRASAQHFSCPLISFAAPLSGYIFSFALRTWLGTWNVGKVAVRKGWKRKSASGKRGKNHTYPVQEISLCKNPPSVHALQVGGKHC